MDKDEILKEHGATLHDEAYQYSCDTEDLRRAMDEWAKEQAIAFVDWIVVEGYKSFDHKIKGTWLKGGMSIAVPTQKIYNDYLLHLQNSK
jgi:hypothetical protein